MSDIYNFTILQGSSFSTTLAISNSDGSKMNLSGFSGRALVKNKYSDTGYLLDLKPVIDSSYVSGLVTISGSGNATASLPAGRFLYDLEIFKGEYILKPIRGYFNVEAECTY